MRGVEYSLPDEYAAGVGAVDDWVLSADSLMDRGRPRLIAATGSSCGDGIDGKPSVS